MRAHPFRRASIAVATLALLVSAVPVAAQDAPEASFGDAWESVACDTFGVVPEIQELADCGYVTVPENRSAGTDATIRLAVVRLHGQTADPGAPLMLATGGPGGDGLGSVTTPGQIAAYAPLLADRDLVFFSQRGTKHAEPELVCVEFGNAQVRAAQAGSTAEDRTAASVEALQGCVDSFTGQGIDLSAYNSNENADDVDAIREALGYERIILNGHSYGTLLTQFVMQRHPDILEAVIIDGIVPKSATSEAQYQDYADAFGRIWAACAADAACSAAYPDPEGALAEAYAALEAEPQAVDMATPNGAVPLMLDGSLAMQALFTGSVPAGGYANAPSAAYALRDGDTGALGQALWFYLNPDGYYAAMFYAIMCSDDPVTDLTSPDGKAPMYVDADDRDENRFPAFCPVLDVAQLDDESDEPVVSDIPALLLQGGLDGPTPPANGDIVASDLSTAYNVVFPAGTHIQALSSPCAVSIMQAFMADPMNAPDTSCVPEGYAFRVPLSATATSEDGSASFSFTLPPGFGELPDGGFGNAIGQQVVARFSTEPTPAQAIETYLAGLAGGPLTIADDAVAVEGDPVAGFPSASVQTEAGLPSGGTITIDIVAFGDDGGSYIIVGQNQLPAMVPRFREVDLPAILESVTLGES